MNRFVRLIKENTLPSIIFAIIVVSCGAAWYYLHPASPYHARYSFVVRYDAIGTLSPGNRVEVRGISAGEITKVELTEDAVFVTARVYATTKIPVNSEFRLINSGLMGEREMCVLTGDSPKLIHDGDTLNGHFDEGTSGVGIKLAGIMKDVDEIKDTVKAFVDSLRVGESGKRLGRIVTKGKKIIRVADADLKSWVREANAVLDNLNGSLQEVKSALDGVVDQGTPKVEAAKKLISRVDGLLLKMNDLKGQGEDIIQKLSNNSNTAGLVLKKSGDFNRELGNVSKDLDALIKDIKKQGLRLNVDIL